MRWQKTSQVPHGDGTMGRNVIKQERKEDQLFTSTSLKFQANQNNHLLELILRKAKSIPKRLEGSQSSVVLMQDTYQIISGRQTLPLVLIDSEGIGPLARTSLIHTASLWLLAQRALPTEHTLNGFLTHKTTPEDQECHAKLFSIGKFFPLHADVSIKKNRNYLPPCTSRNMCRCHFH